MEIIHIVLGKANPERMNGVNKVVFQLATKQAELGLDVSVWGITADISQNYGERSFKTLLFAKNRNPFSIGKDLVQSLKSKKGKAVFHIHGGWIPIFSKIGSILSAANIPYVFTPHGAYNTVAMQRSNMRKKIYFQLFEKSLIRNASKIHCIGQSEVEGLNNIFATDKTFLQPYGYLISEQEFNNKPLKGNDFVIGFVGRIDIYTKGLDLLIDAFCQFQQSVPEAKLWIVGDGTEKENLLKYVNNKCVAGSVILFGSKFGTEKDELIKAMHVFAHPSRNEGLPAAVLEASSFNVPSIVTHATNVGQYISNYNCGIAIENENVNQLVDALKKTYQLWKQDELNYLGANARKMLQETFDWNIVMKNFSKLYEIS